MAVDGCHSGHLDVVAHPNSLYGDRHVTSGTLDFFIQHLIPTADYCPDKSYIFTFILSSRLFILPHQLMNQVCQTCILQQNLKTDQISTVTVGQFGPNMMHLLGEWSDNFPYDFRDERMLTYLKDMTQLLISIHPDLRRNVSMLMHNLYSKLTALHKYEDLLTKIEAEAAQRLLTTNNALSTDISEVCPSPLVLSQQLTHIELERLSMIGPEEFVQTYMKEKSTDIAHKDAWKTSNIDFYIQWFNRLSYMVATQVCVHLKKRNRVRLIEYFVDVAKECINIGNFNSLMAIISGLNMGCIQRLKKTWAKANKEKFDILEHQTNPANNFSSYRSSLKAAMWRSEGASEDRERIVIPFFSLLVKDIYVLNESCANRLPNGHINFEKFTLLSKQLNELMTWRNVDCPFDRHPAVLNFLLTSVVLGENSLSLASYDCEPADSSFEKQQVKQLKEQAAL